MSTNVSSRWNVDILKNMERAADLLMERETAVVEKEYFQMKENQDLDYGYLEGIKIAEIPPPVKKVPDIKLKEDDGSYGLLGPSPYTMITNSKDHDIFMRRPIHVENSFRYPKDVLKKYNEEHPGPTKRSRIHRKSNRRFHRPISTFVITETGTQFRGRKPLILATKSPN